MAMLDRWALCPRCGGRLDNDLARAACPACGSVYYAASAPCVCALVEDERGRVLLARRAIEPDIGLWDVPGGFLEEGEHPIDGLVRELREETGTEVAPTAFLGVWMDVYGDAPDASHTLNLYWRARIVAGAPAPADDVAELRWFGTDELPASRELAFHTAEHALAAWAAAVERG